MAISLLNIVNPDSASISSKDTIDISVSMFDVSASGHYADLQTNYSMTELVVTIPEVDYLNSSSYYTPIYKEELSYDVWLTRINKNFEELD